MQEYGINSNTSANGFIKCVYKKREIAQAPPADSSPKKTSPSKSESSPKKKSPAKVGGDEEDDSDSERAEDSEREEDNQEKQANNQKFEWISLPPFRDLYKITALYKFMEEFGQNIVPLTVVGTFLNYVGNHLTHYIMTVMKRRIFFPSHKVTSI